MSGAMPPLFYTSLWHAQEQLYLYFMTENFILALSARITVEPVYNDIG
jgi:hypothetical protein